MDVKLTDDEKEFIQSLFEAAFDPEGFDLSYNDPHLEDDYETRLVWSQRRHKWIPILRIVK